MEDRTLLSTFLVDFTADSGSGSLRQAILDSNAATGGTEHDRLRYPGPGRADDRSRVTLAAISTAALIDGFSQPGYARHTVDRAQWQIRGIRRWFDDHGFGLDDPWPGIVDFSAARAL